MKAQRRHELKENDLAHALNNIRDYLDENGKQVTIGVIIIAAVIAAVVFGVRSKAAALEDVYRRRAQLNFDDPQIGRESLDALASMTKDVSNDRFLFTSLIQQGQAGLRLARQVPASPDRELTLRAQKAFQELLTRFGNSPLAKGIARSGLATVEENLFVLDGDVSHKDQAREHLQALVDDETLNGMPFKRVAMDRLEALDRTFTRVEFSYPVPDTPTPALGADQPKIDVDEAVEQLEPSGATDSGSESGGTP